MACALMPLVQQQPQFAVMQCNGQRIYAPFGGLKEPPRGSEVFVGNLPRDLLEDELIPLLAEAGAVFRMRLMMDFDERSRGFAFVTYFQVESASRAVLKFDGCLVESRTRRSVITVSISVDNRRLYLGNLPRNKTQHELEAIFNGIVDGIENVVLYMDRHDASKNRGFAFVEFISHATAAIAKRKLQNVSQELFDEEQDFGVEEDCFKENGFKKSILVDWAEPEPVVDPRVAREVKILYFKNVPVQWTPREFKMAVLKMVDRRTVERVYKKENYAFVHFESRKSAEHALSFLLTNIKTYVTHGKRMGVEWSRPMAYSKRYRNNLLPDNLCTSVPVQQRRTVISTRKLQKRSVPRYPSCNSSDISSESDDEIKGLIGAFKPLCLCARKF